MITLTRPTCTFNRWYEYVDDPESHGGNGKMIFIMKLRTVIIRYVECKTPYGCLYSTLYLDVHLMLLQHSSHTFVQRKKQKKIGNDGYFKA
jgi:hypothetical protein